MPRFVDEGRVVNVIFMNFIKVFNTAFHKILIYWMGSYSLDGWTTK